MPHHPIDVMRSLEREMNAQIERLKPILVDKSCSLNERWDMFTQVAHLLPTEKYSDGGLQEFLNTPAYDMGVERYETCSYRDIWVRFMEDISWYESNPDYSRKRDGSPTKEMLDSWREAILASGYGSFTSHWRNY